MERVRWTKFLKIKHFKNETIVIFDQFISDSQTIYVSISPECKPLPNKMSMDQVETLDSDKNADGAMYVSVLSDITEDYKEENKCYDICVMILNDHE
jgi:hypothetical protein